MAQDLETVGKEAGAFSLEMRTRRAVRALLAPPIILVVGVGSIINAITDLPMALMDQKWLSAVFHILEIPVGVLCLVPPLVLVSWAAFNRIERLLQTLKKSLVQVSSFVKRVFPKEILGQD